MKILKALFTIIAIICIAFTAFFAYSYISGNTVPIAIIGHQLSQLGAKNPASADANADGSAAASTLASEYGLSASQANTVVELAGSLGVNTGDQREVDEFVAKNIDKVGDVQELANAVQSGKMSEAEAYARLAGMLDV